MMIVEMNEGARRANDKMHQQSVRRELDAIHKELRLLREVIETLVKEKAKPAETEDYHGEGV